MDYVDDWLDDLPGVGLIIGIGLGVGPGWVVGVGFLIVSVRLVAVFGTDLCSGRGGVGHDKRWWLVRKLRGGGGSSSRQRTGGNGKGEVQRDGGRRTRSAPNEEIGPSESQRRGAEILPYLENEAPSFHRKHHVNSARLAHVFRARRSCS